MLIEKASQAAVHPSGGRQRHLATAKSSSNEDRSCQETQEMCNRRIVPEPQDLTEVLLACQAGSDPAAEELASRHYASIRHLVGGIARKASVPEQDWDDLVQETFRRVLDPHVRRFQPDRCGPWQYLYGIALNALDSAKRRRRRRYQTATSVEAALAQHQLSISDGNASARSELAEERLTLASLIGRADAQIRQALCTMLRDDLNQREAAQVVGLSEWQMSRRLTEFYIQAREAA